MEIRLRVEDPELAGEHARSLRSRLMRDGWETELEYGTDTVTVLLPQEGGAVRLAWSVVEWRDGRTGTPDVVPATADGTPLPAELVRILAEGSPSRPGGTITVLEPDAREAIPDSAARIAGDWHVGPPGPVLDPDDDWDRD